MCVVSMIMDHYGDDWSKRIPIQPLIPITVPLPYVQPPFPNAPAITQAEIEEFRKLLERARKYDIKNNEPDCEMEEKKAKLKKLAEELGVKIDFL